MKRCVCGKKRENGEKEDEDEDEDEVEVKECEGSVKFEFLY